MSKLNKTGNCKCIHHMCVLFMLKDNSVVFYKNSSSRAFNHLFIYLCMYLFI
jgi:hypothetical protein